MIDSKKFQFEVYSYEDLRNAVQTQRDERFVEYAGFLNNLKTCPDLDEDLPCLFLVFDRHDNIVSMIKAFPDTLYFSTGLSPMVWTGNLFTVCAFRGQGLATFLLEMRQKYLGEKRLFRGSVFSTDVALHIHRKLGDHVLGHLPRYLLFKSIRPFIGERIGGFPGTVSERIMLPVLSFWHSLKRPNPGYSTIEIDTHSPDWVWKDVFSALPDQHTCHFNNQFEKILWKIRCSNQKPHNQTSLYVLSDLSDKNPIAYAVIRESSRHPQLRDKMHSRPVMTLADYGIFMNVEIGLHQLAHFVMGLFIRSKSEVLEIFPNSKDMERILRKWGMLRAGKGMSFSMTIPPSNEFKDLPLKLNNWCLNPFCGDAFTF